MDTSCGKKPALWREVIRVVIVFSLALIPRITSLNTFATADESEWIERSTDFLMALLDFDFVNTFRSVHPGVTTLWSGTMGVTFEYLFQHRSLSLEFPDFLQTVRADPISTDWLGAMRLPVALLVAIGVVAFYLLVRRLFDTKIAFLSAIFLSLDPFYLAHSRLLHVDALGATFMVLTLLSLMVYLRAGQSPFLVLSGITLGLSLLTRSPSLFLVPFAVLLVALCYLSSLWGLRKRLFWWVLIMTVWGTVAVVTFFGLWPAMWVNPIGSVGKVIGFISETSAFHRSGEGLGTFFFGKALPVAPGSLYLMVLLFKCTPITLAGLLASMYLLVVGYRQSYQGSATRVVQGNSVTRVAPKTESEKERDLRAKLLVLLLYGFLFTVFMALGVPRIDRYLLPVFPVIDLLAAVGWCWLAERAVGWWGKRSLWGKGTYRLGKQPLVIFGFVLALFLQGGFSLPCHPYYLSYYNPLVGGGLLAPQIMLVGWGEGLDQAARYLNGKENAAKLRVAAWFDEDSFGPFFPGKSWQLRRERIFWNDVDYVVLYLQQVQCQPDQELIRFFQSLEAEHIVRVNGISYAWVYKVPKPLPEVLLPYEPVARLGDAILLLDYTFMDSKDTPPGRLRLHLLWRALREMKEDYTVYLKLVNGAYHVWGQQDGRPYWGGLPTNSWEKGQIVRDQREIEILPGTPPGPYLVEVTFYDPHRRLDLEPDDGSALLLGPITILPRDPPSVESLDIEHPVEAILGGKVRLLGYNIESGFRPGDNIHLTLFWQCLAEIEQDYSVFTHFVDDRGDIWVQRDNEPIDGFYSTTRWKVGEIVRDQYDLVIPSDVPSGEYRLNVGMYLAKTGERLNVLKDGVPLPDNRILLQLVAVGGMG